MTTLYTTMDRLIGEHLDELLALGWEVDEQLRSAATETDEPSHQPTMPFVRVISAVRLLHQKHTVDAKGRCRICTERRRFWHRTRTQPCTVHSAFSFYLTQSDELVLSEIPRPRAAPGRPPLELDLRPTIELPRIPDD